MTTFCVFDLIFTLTQLNSSYLLPTNFCLLPDCGSAGYQQQQIPQHLCSAEIQPLVASAVFIPLLWNLMMQERPYQNLSLDQILVH